jgi:hypothetical protein
MTGQHPAPINAGRHTEGPTIMFRRSRILATVAFAGALALATVAPTFAADQAKVRALHASPDAPAVDVYVNDAKVLSDVTFRTLSDYLPLDAGTYTVAIKAAGTDTVVASLDASVEAGKEYTIAAIGKLASIKLTAFVDDGATTADAAKLRVVHLSPDTGAVDVALAGQAPADAPVKDLAYPDATGYLTLPAGSYDFVVRPTGTETVALSLAGTALAAATNYTVFAVGLSAADAPADQKLGVVVGVDAQGSTDTSTGGTTGSTPPPTSTVAPTSSTGGPAVPIAALAVALAAAGLALAAVRRRTTVPNR